MARSSVTARTIPDDRLGRAAPRLSPPSTLSIAVVTTSWNATHAVLLVAGDKGEYVLDNLSPWVVPWNEAPYTFRKRQVAGDAFHWAIVTPAASSVRYAGLSLIAL